ncbi:glycosyltransferase family 90 protein [Schizophyllum amplum]|uniref:Glycosyltransferase family 90 protein n=1 Tax=Schizophyllum amplum TaxID=97359 RepID=A0A550CY70_9AGAR|nr:glycosyltransferase family 90 protein [Auriculariopsis ampla]
MRRSRFLHILSPPKPRPLFRTILLVASIYAVVSFTFTFWSHSDSQLEAGVVRSKLRDASRSTIQILSQYARLQPSPSPQPRKSKNKLADARGGTAATGKHKYHQNGLLEVNAKGAHPIYELMARADAQWRKKQAKASRTLEQAVIEYRRRYKRNPPKGFDIWWDFVQKHNVQLPDEYDQIYSDFEHMWGVYPPDLIDIQQEMMESTQQDWYAIGRNEEGRVDVTLTAFTEGHDHLISNSYPIVDLLQEVEEYLPSNFTIMVSPHDGPSRHTDYAYKQTLLDAAWRKGYLKRSQLPEIRRGVGWTAACHPSSFGGRYAIKPQDDPKPREGKTFIYDHTKSMSPCYHTNLFHEHGQFISHFTGPNPREAMIAQYAYSSTTIHHDIRMPSPYGWIDDLPNEPEWEEKTDNRLLWRGSTTGMHHGPKVRWDLSHRLRMVALTNNLTTTIPVLDSRRGRDERVGQPLLHESGPLTLETTDIAFAGSAHLCSAEVCDQIEEKYKFADYQSIDEAANYKYIMDIDGNAWSGRFKRLLTANSVIFKATIYPEWYNDRIQPWLHYVPVQMDYSDLYDALVFFRGDENGEGAHDDLARKIAVQGRKWSKDYWRREDLQAYFIRSLLEYIRLMSVDREAMTYHGPGSE